MERADDIIIAFLDRLEHVLEDNLVSFSERLHKHLMEHEARLKAAYQQRFDIGLGQVLAKNKTEDACQADIIPTERDACLSEASPAEAAARMGLKEAPQVASRIEETLATETAAQPPQTFFHTATTQELTSVSKAMTWQDNEEWKKQRAHRKCTEMRLSQSTDKGTSTSALRRLQEQVATMVVHPWFENFFMVLIAGNMVMVILQLEVARSEHKPMDELFEFQVAQHALTILFVIELALRIFAKGRAFFFLTNPTWGWDYFDLVIVSTSIMEPMVHFLADRASRQSWTLRMIRVLRVVSRVSRLIRTFRLARGFAPLRVMLESLYCSLKSLIWVVVLMLFTMTVCAVLFSSSVMEHVLSKEESGNVMTKADLQLQASFGSLRTCLLTEYMAITGGIDWGETAQLLELVHPVWFAVFLIYHVFLFLAFLNVVTGVFCQGAIEGATHDQAIVIENHMAAAEQYAKRLKSLFNDIDDDGSGTITIDEMESHLRDTHVSAYLASLDIDPTDTWTLFSLLDADGTYEIHLEEFVRGCLRLKGNAKAVDLVRLGYENRFLSKQVQSIEKHILHLKQFMMMGKIEHQCVQERDQLSRDELLQTTQIYSVAL